MENGRQWYGRILVGIANLASLLVAIVRASIPILTSVFSIRWLMRRARERRAVASDTSTLLPTTSD